VKLFLLPVFKPTDLYASLEVTIPSQKLVYAGNIALRLRAAWGTEVFTDDSDVIAACVHSGLYTPIDTGAWEERLKEGQVGSSDTKLFYDYEEGVEPSHDLVVSLVILPRLVQYTGTENKNGFKSRSFVGTHHGESFRVVDVKKVPAKHVGGGSKRASPSKKKQKLTGVPGADSVHLVSSSTMGSDFCYKYAATEFADWITALKSGGKLYLEGEEKV
jgi:hypothetical protein